MGRRAKPDDPPVELLDGPVVVGVAVVVRELGDHLVEVANRFAGHMTAFGEQGPAHSLRAARSKPTLPTASGGTSTVLVLPGLRHNRG